jgi:hypothetical protein
MWINEWSWIWFFTTSISRSRRWVNARSRQYSCANMIQVHHL